MGPHSSLSLERNRTRPEKIPAAVVTIEPTAPPAGTHLQGVVGPLVDELGDELGRVLEVDFL